MALKSTSVPLRPPRLQDHSPHGPLSVILSTASSPHRPPHRRRHRTAGPRRVRRTSKGRTWRQSMDGSNIQCRCECSVYEDEGDAMNIACVWHTTYQHCMRPFIQWQTPRSTVMMHSFIRSSLRACVHACIRVVVDSTTRDCERT